MCKVLFCLGDMYSRKVPEHFVVSKSPKTTSLLSRLLLLQTPTTPYCTTSVVSSPTNNAPPGCSCPTYYTGEDHHDSVESYRPVDRHGPVHRRFLVLRRGARGFETDAGHRQPKMCRDRYDCCVLPVFADFVISVLLAECKEHATRYLNEYTDTDKSKSK